MNQPQGQPTTDNVPLYNIGAVTRMTGVSIATLRAWERRYGFPQSGRTGGGHRLYSEQDVLHLRWVKGKIEEGLQTAQAIQALHRHLATSAEQAATATTEPLQPEHGDKAVSVRDRLYDALIHHDLDKADQILGEALPVLHPEGLILDVIGPAMAAIGDAWQNKQISVAAEHLATHYLRQRLLMWMISGPPPQPMRPLVLACAPNELHEGGLLMLGALLRRRRWPVAYLGQTTPLPDLADLVRDIHPPLIVLSATTEESAGALAEWPLWLPEVAQTGQPIVSFAGRIFSEQAEWRMRVPGAFLGTSIRAAVETIERLLH
jgi:DNA-binding transcriptional MerR regulator